MNFFIKVLVTFGVLGAIGLFCAAAIQGYSQHAADLLGYSGLWLWSADVVMVGIVFLFKVWINDIQVED